MSIMHYVWCIHDILSESKYIQCISEDIKFWFLITEVSKKLVKTADITNLKYQHYPSDLVVFTVNVLEPRPDQSLERDEAGRDRARSVSSPQNFPVREFIMKVSVKRTLIYDNRYINFHERCVSSIILNPSFYYFCFHASNSAKAESGLNRDSESIFSRGEVERWARNHLRFELWFKLKTSSFDILV